MPPTKRGRPAASRTRTVVEDEADVSANESPRNAEPEVEDENQNDEEEEEEEELIEEEEEEKIRFFNTTFSAFRVSPLYIGRQALTPTGLELLSRRLRDTLVGDVVRGVQIGLESDYTLGSAGALERVEWRERDIGLILPTLAGEERETGNGTRNKRPRRRGPQRLLQLELDYEYASFSALLLPSFEDEEGEESRIQRGPLWNGKSVTFQDGDGDESGNGSFEHFPLLLTRMPAPLKATLVDFLSSSFDCRISPLHLGTRTLVGSLERWIEHSGVAEGNTLDRDLALTLGFHIQPPEDQGNVTYEAGSSRSGPDPSPQLGLKTIDIVVPAEDVRRFLRAGVEKGSRQNLPIDIKRRRKLAGANDEEGWGWRDDPQNNHTENGRTGPDANTKQPFAEALALYLDHHLALDLFHPGVRVMRVVCDAFALSDGRIKLFAVASRDKGLDRGDARYAAIETFMRDLVRRAQGKSWSHGALHLAGLVAGDKTTGP
ncbi:kinetochore complex Sim4 subunit Fta1-domain-containing protein [Poronia punctata]|nr:kinetochore complex Sim4 subunit Fta1-domain-containing protein [Poronia punctata]